MSKLDNFKGKQGVQGFSKNPSNINMLGRPKKIYTVLAEQGYSKDDIKTAFGELGWYTLEELQNVHSDNAKPLIVRIIANQFILAFEKGDFSKVKEILEHVTGRPKIEIDQTITPVITGITFENVSEQYKCDEVGNLVNNEK